MKATQTLHNLGQSIWLDNITRALLNSGTLQTYIDQLSVTGLTSNPTIFDHAIKNSTAYDADIRRDIADGKSGDKLFFDLALSDLTRAAALFRPIHERTDGVDGWVFLRYRRCSLTTPKPPWPRPPRCMPRLGNPTSSSRFRAPKKVSPPLRRPPSRASQSTSPCCFHANSTSLLPKRICAGSRGASKRDWTPPSAR